MSDTGAQPFATGPRASRGRSAGPALRRAPACPGLIAAGCARQRQTVRGDGHQRPGGETGHARPECAGATRVRRFRGDFDDLEVQHPPGRSVRSWPVRPYRIYYQRTADVHETSTSAGSRTRHRRRSSTRVAPSGPRDLSAFRTAVKQKTFTKAADADLKLGNETSVGGTPTMFLNGQRVPDPSDFKGVASLIDKELAW